MKTLKLFGTGAATANGVANVTIPSKTRIRGCQCFLFIDSITDSVVVQVEISRASANEMQVNGAQQCICEFSMAGNFVTSGLAQAGVNQFFPVDIAMEQGQLVYMHARVVGTVTYTAQAILHYD